MKLVCNTRRLDTPQTTKSGRVRKNIAGEAVYTEYLVLTSDRYLDLTQHMNRYINIISDFSDAEFGVLTEKVDLNEKTQINSEPVPYNYLERLQIVLDRLKNNDDMTTGIIDMYNHVVCRALRALDFPIHEIERARVTIEDPDFRRMRNRLSPDLFDLGDE